MKWSKLKKQAEAFLADPLKQRIQYHTTHYIMARGNYEGHGRAWITLDGQEIASFSEIEYELAYVKTVTELRQASGFVDYQNPDHQEGYYLADKQAQKRLKENGRFSQSHFISALKNVIQLSIEQIIESNDPVIFALGMLDRRLGKRRLRDLDFGEEQKALASKLYQIRCEAENL